MPTAASAMSGAVTINATAAHEMSNRRFTMLQSSADGHEDFRGLEALLIAPGERPVAQRVERARMRIGTDFARVAGHCGELDVERRGDIHPRIGGERARIGPLGAAGGVEGVDRAHPARGWTRSDERGLKQHLVIAVDVAAPLAIHDPRLELFHEGLER